MCARIAFARLSITHISSGMFAYKKYIISPIPATKSRIRASGTRSETFFCTEIDTYMNRFYPLLCRHIIMRVVTAIILLAAVSHTDAPASGTREPTVALVLSGGGARGLSQLGALQCLDSMNITPDLIVASSIGAIIGGLYASGYSADSIIKMSRRVEWRKFFSNRIPRRHLFMNQKLHHTHHLFELTFNQDLEPIIPNAISSGQYFYTFLLPRLLRAQVCAGGNFDSLPVPLRLVSTDILSGSQVVLRDGDLCTAIKASSSIPFAFSPVRRDSMLLVDGGLTSNIPCKAARRAGADIIIAIDATSPLYSREDLSSPLHIALQIANLHITRRSDEEKKEADILITPRLDSFTNMDFDSVNAIIRSGYLAAKEVLPALRDTPASRSPHSIMPPDSAVSPDNSAAKCRTIVEKKKEIPAGSSIPPPFLIDRIVIEGNTHTQAAFIEGLLPFIRGDTLVRHDISDAMSTLYATDLFHTVHVSIDTGGTLCVQVSEKPRLGITMSARFDQFHLFEGYARPYMQNLFGSAYSWQFHLQYGLRRERYELLLEGSPLFFRKFGSTLRLKSFAGRERIVQHIETDTVDTGNTTGTISHKEHSLHKAGAVISAGAHFGKSILVQARLRAENYRVYRSEKSVIEERSFPKGLRYLQGALFIDNLDRSPFPLTGRRHYVTITQSLAYAGSKHDFYSIEGELRRYFEIYPGHVISPRLSVFRGSDPLPAPAMFYLGGLFNEKKYHERGVYNYISFIGLTPRALPGNALIKTELRYRLKVMSHMYLFSQLNTAHASRGYKWNRDFFSGVIIGTGAGLSYDTALGPLRGAWGAIVGLPPRFDEALQTNHAVYLSLGYTF